MAALADLPDLAIRISAALTAASLPHAVSGAMAMASHGFVRTTRDIDLLVVVPALRLPEVFAVVRGFGFEGEDRDLVAAFRERAVAELRSGPASVEILAPVLPYHHEVLRRAVRTDCGGTVVPAGGCGATGPEGRWSPSVTVACASAIYGGKRFVSPF